MQVRQVKPRIYIAAGISLLFFASSLGAQTASSGSENTGPAASELVTGSSTSLGGMLKFDTGVGYNFTKNFGADVGIPYFLVTRPGLFEDTLGHPGYVSYPYIGCTFFFGCYTGIATSSRMWGGELGDLYLDLHYTRPYRRYNLASVLTGDTPTASFRKGLTTGRVQWDWLNHIDTDIHGFSPFVNLGLANGRIDQHFLPRPFNTDLPFRTLGYMADFEGGVQYKVWRRFTLGASVWDVLPWGTQKIYSELVWQGPTPGTASILPPLSLATTPVPGNLGFVAGDPNHGRFWNSAFEKVGPSSIARDNGYSATASFSPFRNIDFQVGYNHSVRYALDAVTFGIQFNANSLVRKITNF